MKRNAKWYIVCALTLICAGTTACTKTQTTTTEAEEVSEFVNYENDTSALDVSLSEMPENADATEAPSSVDDAISENVRIEDRLLIIPIEEDIPESVKLVFSEYIDFNVVFDLGYEVYSRENGDAVELYTEYLSAEDYPSGVASITTNVKNYDEGAPYYSENWKFPLYWYAYKVIDMDNDGVNELIYRVSPKDRLELWDDYYLIFHDIGGQVYAYATNLSCAQMTEEGLMTIGHGSKDILYKISSFDEERYYIDCLAYYSSIPDSENPTYVLYDRYVSSEEWGDFYNENYTNKEKAVFKSTNGPIVIQ